MEDGKAQGELSGRQELVWETVGDNGLALHGGRPFEVGEVARGVSGGSDVEEEAGRGSTGSRVKERGEGIETEGGGEGEEAEWDLEGRVVHPSITTGRALGPGLDGGPGLLVGAGVEHVTGAATVEAQVLGLALGTLGWREAGWGAKVVGLGLLDDTGCPVDLHVPQLHGSGGES